MSFYNLGPSSQQYSGQFKLRLARDNVSFKWVGRHIAHLLESGVCLLSDVMIYIYKV